MDKMREEFERFMDLENAEYDRKALEGAWLVWQHLCPMVEAAYREGMATSELDDLTDDDIKEMWLQSTAKARLEGKDE